MAKREKVDLTGQRFDRLFVLEYGGGIGGRRFWKCLCDCGNTVLVSTGNLQNENNRSCGCLHTEIVIAIGKNNTKHGAGGKQKTPEYRSWNGAKNRCMNVRNKNYENYGGRGIRFSERWQGRDGFINFLQDMGLKPSPLHSLDRIDVDGNYEPLNCRWADSKVQYNNRRVKKIEEFRNDQIAAQYFKRYPEEYAFFEGTPC